MTVTLSAAVVGFMKEKGIEPYDPALFAKFLSEHPDLMAKYFQMIGLDPNHFPVHTHQPTCQTCMDNRLRIQQRMQTCPEHATVN